MEGLIRVTIDLEQLAAELYKAKRYVTVSEIARRLGVSEKTAGKVLARLESLGYARRYSYRAYELLPPWQGSDEYTLIAVKERTAHTRVINR